jgi:succinate dehydrogenase / fumarate reductase, flavoprotein subunit
MSVAVPGCYAAGECACASVHGANRLGTNSLLDLLVFGKSAGESAVEDVKKSTRAHKALPQEAIERTLARLARLDTQQGGADVHESRLAMQRTMQNHCGVFRFAGKLKEGVSKILEVQQDVQRTGIKDKSKVFNTARIEALELDNLIEVAVATMISAEARKESRGAHVRDDAPDTAEHPNGRDDANWLKHSLWFKEGNRLDYKSVKLTPLTVDTIELKKRAY